MIALFYFLVLRKGKKLKQINWKLHYRDAYNHISILSCNPYINYVFLVALTVKCKSKMYITWMQVEKLKDNKTGWWNMDGFKYIYIYSFLLKILFLGSLGESIKVHWILVCCWVPRHTTKRDTGPDSTCSCCKKKASASITFFSHLTQQRCLAVASSLPNRSDILFIKSFLRYSRSREWVYQAISRHVG